MQRIIALCGYPGVGKDETAMRLAGYGFKRVSFADPMRRALLALNPAIMAPAGTLCRLSSLVEAVGWTEAKKVFEVRELLQRMGTEAGRDIHGEDCWTRIAEKELRANERSVITDMRFANEVGLVDRLARQGFRVFKLHISRPGHGPVNNHASEQMDYQSIADGEISNNGDKADLYSAVDDFVREFMKQ